MRLHKSWSVALIAFVLPLAALNCASDEPSGGASRTNGALVFTASSLPGSGPVQLYSMEADGTQLRQLTDDLSQKTAVTSSPDGSKLAYAAFDNELTADSPAPEPTSIFVMEADGSGRQELCDACARTAYAFEPEKSSFEPPTFGTFYAVPNSLAWSPTGSTLAVPAVTPGVVLFDVETGQVTTIETPEPITAIAWSPDGTRLAMSHTWFIGHGSQMLIMVPRDGTELEIEPSALPGGVYVLDLGTGDLDEVLRTPRLAHVHGWSADGDRIAFTRGTSMRTEVSAYSVSEDRTWTVVPGETGDISIGVGWSPSDDAIAALVNGNNEQGNIANVLWLTPGTDVELRRELPLCLFDGAFDGDLCAMATIAWSPDGTIVAYRAILSGTPVRSAVVLQGIDASVASVVQLDGPSFYNEVSPCCLAWLPAA